VPEQRYCTARLSPDDTRIAAHISEVQDFISIYDLPRGEGRQLPSASSIGWPIWTHDGQSIIASSARPSGGNIIVQLDVIGGRPSKELGWTAASFVTPGWISADGKKFGIFQAAGGKSGEFDLSAARGGPLGTPLDLRMAPGHGDLSPDAKWILGPREGEIWVASMTDPNDAVRISNAGGGEVVWCRACPEVFYRTGSRWYSARITSMSPFAAAPARLAWETDFIDTPGRSYDVSRDGKRLLISKRTRQDVLDRIHLVRNWTALVPQ